MNRFKPTALVLVILIAGVAGVHYWHDPSANRDAQPTVSQAIATQVPAKPSAAKPAALPKLLPKKIGNSPVVRSVPNKEWRSIRDAPGDAAKEAMSDAQSGLPDAMRVVAQALRECSHAEIGSNDEIEQLVAKRSLGRDLLRGDGKKGDPAGDASEAKRLEGIRDSCSQFPRSETDRWLDWFEKAAAAGDSEARANFAWSALADFVTPQAREENADEYLRRRDEAFGFLQDSIANGDCSNGILNGFRKVSPDPLNQYVYEGLLLQHALDDYASGKIPYPPDVISQETQSINVTLSNLARSVPEEQRGAAQATIRDILQNYCRQF